MPNKASSGQEFAKVQIYANADHIDEFNDFYRKLGMSQREAGSRLFDWFNRQAPLIRHHILQPMPEDVAPDIARIVLERMAEQDRHRNSSSAAAEQKSSKAIEPPPSSVLPSP